MANNITHKNYSVISLNNKEIFYKLIFIFIGVISSFITISGTIMTTSNNEYQYLLPLSYTIAYTLLAPSINKLGFGYFILNFVWIIRYCIIPSMNVMCNNMHQLEEKYLIMALFIMFIELWITFISIKYYYTKFKCKNIYYSINREINSNVKNINTNLIIFFILISICIILIDPKAVSGFNFILNQDLTNKGDANFGTFTLILNWVKYLVTVYLVGKFQKKYNTNKSHKYLIFSIITAIISISIFRGTSRNGILVEASAYVYLLIKLYPQYKKKIGAFFLTVVPIIIVSVTLYRFHDIRSITGISNLYDINRVASMLNIYFSGQHNVGIGLKSLDLFGSNYNVYTVFKDFFANTIFINRFLTQIPGTVYYFNYAFYGHALWADQISPLITQGIGLFNIFGFLIPIILMNMIVRIDLLSKKEYFILGIFINALIASKLAFYSHGNITIISTFMMNQALPLFLIYRISKRIKS